MRRLLLTLLACSAAFEPKLCITCKHFIKAENNRYAKCKQFPILVYNMEDLIAGYSKQQFTDYNYSSTARQFGFMCGEKGKRYEKIEFIE
jgi:hypothetical protein